MYDKDDEFVSLDEGTFENEGQPFKQWLQLVHRPSVRLEGVYM